MIALLLAAAASLPTAIDAERAFAADAQRLGQWTAFRKYADPDAVMFTPQAAWARDFLKDRKDPPASVRWWPERSFVSCDGRTAVNSGPALDRGRKALRHLHHGVAAQKSASGPGSMTMPLRSTATPKRRAPPRVTRASCKGAAPGAPVIPPPGAYRQAGPHHAGGQRPRPFVRQDARLGLARRKERRASFPRLSVERHALRAGHLQQRAS